MHLRKWSLLINKACSTKTLNASKIAVYFILFHTLVQLYSGLWKKNCLMVFIACLISQKWIVVLPISACIIIVYVTILKYLDFLTIPKFSLLLLNKYFFTNLLKLRQFSIIKKLIYCHVFIFSIFLHLLHLYYFVCKNKKIPHRTWYTFILLFQLYLLLSKLFKKYLIENNESERQTLNVYLINGRWILKLYLKLEVGWLISDNEKLN